MKKISETIIFFGSGPVAAESLRRLAADFNIEAVVTKPQPKHHSNDISVLKLSEGLKINTHTVADKNDLSELFKNLDFKSRLGIVIDFGILIDKKIIDAFPLGIVNSHFSLLPKLRGPDPISFAILEGHEKTGVSLMLINEALDEGKLLAQRSIKLEGKETSPLLTDRLIDLSRDMLLDILPGYINGEIKPYPQDTSLQSTYTRKLEKADSILDWNKPAETLEREIRAFKGWPRSRTELGGVNVVITEAHMQKKYGPVGKVWREGKEFGFYTSKGSLVIDKLIPAGKKEMSAQAFLAGYKV